MSEAIRLDQMSTAEKLSTMEAIWDDLCRHADDVASPEWHEGVLAEREGRYRSGAESAEDWAAAKESIRHQIP